MIKKSQFCIFDAILHKKLNKIAYYAHGPYKRGGLAYVVSIVVPVVSGEHAALLTVLMHDYKNPVNSPVYTSELLSNLDLDDDETMQSMITCVVRKNLLIDHEVFDDPKKPAKSLSYSKIEDDRRIYLKPGISIPKILRIENLLKEEYAENLEKSDIESKKKLLSLMQGVKI